MNILAYVDEDDESKREYTHPCVRKTHMVVGPRVGTAKAIKKLIQVCATDWMMLGSDDIRFETPNWAEKMKAPIPKDRVGISFSKDGFEDQCNHFCFHRRLYDLTGLWPDVFWHFGPDGYIGKVTQAIGRRFFVKDVMVKHLKAKMGRSPQDRTFVESRIKGNGKAEFDKALAFYHDDVKKLRAEIERCAAIA